LLQYVVSTLANWLGTLNSHLTYSSYTENFRTFCGIQMFEIFFTTARHQAVASGLLVAAVHPRQNRM
jgi:hypothetical protein